MKKIEKLTDQQTAKLAEYRDKWMAIGLSTEPLDFEAAKTAAIKAYRCLGLPAPSRFYHFQSPLSGAIGAALLRRDDSVRASVWASVGASVWDSVWDSVRDSVWASVSDSVRFSVRIVISVSPGCVC